jgi:hypothetical protein
MKVVQQPPVAAFVPRSPVVGHGKLLVVIGDETVGGDATVGTVGTSPMAPTVGDTPIVGTGAAELTPRLPISVDPNGIPVRAAPPGVVGDVAVEDEATLLEPEPHIPDNPDVSGIPDVVDIPEVADVPDIDMADGDMADGVPDPIAIPPPSKLVVDPNIPDGEVPTVEHAVLPGIVMVPVEEPGIGLIPGEASSVDPSGIPVGATEEFVVIPSGEVAPIVGVGVAIAPTCATGTLHTNNAGRTAATGQYLMSPRRLLAALRGRAASTDSAGVRRSDIGQVLGCRNENSGNESAAAIFQLAVERGVQLPLFCVERRKSP